MSPAGVPSARMATGPALDRRVPLVTLPTPFEALPRLGAALGMAPGALWVKRDDVNGLGGGGNKARKLEYLCADALARGCDVLVTGGGQQSNHVRMTAAAANRLGLGCVVVVPGPAPAVATGNVVLDELFGPEFVRLDDRPDGGEGLDYYAIEAAILATADRLEADGRRPYAIPVGGASPVGALGYVAAGEELLRQAVEATGAEPDVIVVADGSGGTHAGLAVGIGDHDRILGVDVGARPDVADVLPGQDGRGGGPRRPAAPDRHRRRRPRPGRAALRRPHRRLPGGHRPGRPHRGPAPRPRLHRQGHGRAHGGPGRRSDRARHPHRLPPHRGVRRPCSRPAWANGCGPRRFPVHTAPSIGHTERRAFRPGPGRAHPGRTPGGGDRPPPAGRAGGDPVQVDHVVRARRSAQLTGRIVFASNRDGNLEIYVMDANGANQTRLTDNPTRRLLPVVVARRVQDRLREQPRRQLRDLRHERRRLRPEAAHRQPGQRPVRRRSRPTAPGSPSPATATATSRSTS